MNESSVLSPVAPAGAAPKIGFVSLDLATEYDRFTAVLRTAEAHGFPPPELAEATAYFAERLPIPFFCVDYLYDGERYWFSELEPDGGHARRP